MTSSLVGSEMCIRDSVSLWAAVTTASGRCPVAVPRVNEPPTIATVVAVSYTHLTLPTICSV
eukprot:105271-Prorocentrum_lima.AAC.1